MIDKFKIIWELLTPWIQSWLRSKFPVEDILSLPPSEACKITVVRNILDGVQFMLQYTDYYFFITFKGVLKFSRVEFCRRTDDPFSSTVAYPSLIVSCSTIRCIVDQYYEKLDELSGKRKVDIDENQLDLPKNKKIKIK